MNEVSPGFSCSYRCCLSSVSSFLALILFSLKSYMCEEETLLFSPRRSSRKTCANKPNIYSSAQVCSLSRLLHQHIGGLLTPPTHSGSQHCWGMWGSGWVPDNLGAEVWHSHPLQGVLQCSFFYGRTREDYNSYLEDQKTLVAAHKEITSDA